MLLLLLILLCGCSRRFARLRRSGDARVQVSMPSRRRTPEPAVAPQGDTTAASGPITFTTEDGRELRLVPAAYDDRLQESVMNLRIEQVTISVNNIRNVAERNGKIDLEFSVTLPRELLDDQWRVELEPVLCTRQDTFSLHRLLFTGERFRRLQRQDMARYDRYLHSIVDSGVRRRGIRPIRSRPTSRRTTSPGRWRRPDTCGRSVASFRTVPRCSAAGSAGGRWRPISAC